MDMTSTVNRKKSQKMKNACRQFAGHGLHQ
jgi:hypothetical protein